MLRGGSGDDNHHHNRRMSNSEFESSSSLPRSREISSSDDNRGIEGIISSEPEAPFGEAKLRKCPLCSRVRVRGGGGTTSSSSSL